METYKILSNISRGRTDYMFHLMENDNWKDLLNQGRIKPPQWLVWNLMGDYLPEE